MSNQINVSACEICDNNDFIFILKAYDYIFSCPTEFRFIRCSNCSQISIFPRPSKQYISSKISNKGLRKIDIWHFLEPHRTKIVKKIKKKGRILDVGCGSGEFLVDMKKLGWQVFGNDILSDACDYAKKEFGLENIYNEDLISLDFLQDYFDVVTLWHTLGHLDRPLETLKKINRNLKHDGILIIESPNFDSCQRNIFREKWFGLSLPNYFHHFSPKSLEYILKLAGLEIIKKDYFVNLRINLISFKRSLLRVLHLEHIPDEKGNNETVLLTCLNKLKLIFIFELICFIASLFLALINCGTCFRVYCKKFSN